MEPVFVIIAAFTLISAAAAMSLSRPVHCALSLALTFAGLAAAYLQLHAQFVGFVQVLVYIGAVAVLIVFALLLTRGDAPILAAARRGWCGIVVAATVLAIVVVAITRSKIAEPQVVTLPPPAVPVKQIGRVLLENYVVPLEAMGLLLTAAMVGAVLIAMRDQPRPGQENER